MSTWAHKAATWPEVRLLEASPAPGKTRGFTVSFPYMVSEREGEHFRRIAQAESELNRDAIRACALRDPGANIELGLELSDFAISFGAELTRPDEVAPICLWRQRRSVTEPR